MATTAAIQAQINALTLQVQSLQASQTDLTKQLKQLAVDADQYQQTIDTANAKLASNTLTPAQRIQIEGQLEKAKLGLAQTKQKQAELQQQYQQQQAQINSLKTQINELSASLIAISNAGAGGEAIANNVTIPTAAQASAVAVASALAVAGLSNYKEYGSVFGSVSTPSLSAGDSITAYNPETVENIADNVATSLNNVVEAASSAVSSVFSGSGIFGAASSRLLASGILPGAQMGPPSPPLATVNGEMKDDKRVRISLPPNSPEIFYRSANSLTAPLKDTDGLVFPYTPTMVIAHEARYESVHPTHSNFQFHFYQNSAIMPINLQGDFVARTQTEGRYVLAGILFLQGLTKMFNTIDISQNVKLGGTPPMIARLHGYGISGFDSLPVAITNVQVTYPDDVDYITIMMANPDSPAQPFVYKLPITLTIAVQATPLFSREFATNKFGVLAYTDGKRRLMGDS